MLTVTEWLEKWLPAMRTGALGRRVDVSCSDGTIKAYFVGDMLRVDIAAAGK